MGNAFQRFSSSILALGAVRPAAVGGAASRAADVGVWKTELFARWTIAVKQSEKLIEEPSGRQTLHASSHLFCKAVIIRVWIMN